MFHICLVCSCLQKFNNPLPWNQLKSIGRCNMPNCFTSLQLVIYKVYKIPCFQHQHQTHWFFCKTRLLYFFPSFELYVNYPLFRHRHSLTCDVSMSEEVKHSLFMAPIQGHGEMQWHPNYPAMVGTFQWNFHMFWKQFLWNNICLISICCVHVCIHSTIHSPGVKSKP